MWKIPFYALFYNESFSQIRSSKKGSTNDDRKLEVYLQEVHTNN